MSADPLDLLYLLSDIARLLRAESGRRARARGLGRAEFAALAVLARAPGVTQRELAERLDVEPITVARLLDRLAARGLVERRPDPRDRRVWRLHLGPESGTLNAATAEELADLARHLAEGMEPVALKGVMAGLRHVAGVLAAPVVPAGASDPAAAQPGAARPGVHGSAAADARGLVAPDLVTAGRTSPALISPRHSPDLVTGPGALRETA